MSEHATQDLDTRQRLLEVAGAVFAELGYRGATVRDICQRAEANVASIHYHFGDKDGLYRAVLQSAFEAAEARHPRTGSVDAGASAEEELQAFVLAFLRRIYGGGVPTWLMRIMSREMFEPTGALEHLVRTVHRPTFEHLRGIVSRIGGPSLRDEDALRCAQAVIAQCVFYKHAQAVMKLMGHSEPSTPAEIDQLAQQITRFSLAGIRGSSGSKELRR
ncbi:MAG: CerR family C-terminal domain-containing protein [Planctomycetota bacterium]|nr:CerR family C-terminal domain-containing protein [Planctomycetota bacterium]